MPVLPDVGAENANRIVLCSGKIGHELRVERKKRKDNSVAIVFVEQIYPFPEAELAAELARHPAARDIVWVQEEPANMGALSYMLPRLKRMAGDASGAFGQAIGKREPFNRLSQGSRS